MSIQRKSNVDRGFFTENLTIPAGYNLLNPATRTLDPNPSGLLAYDPGESLVYFSNGSVWQQAGTSDVGPPGSPGPFGYGGPEIFVNKTLYVDPVHTTGTGKRETMTEPFPTIHSAIEDSEPGDLIVVRPGEYTLTDTIILPENKDINLYFEPGSIVTNTIAVFVSEPSENITRNHNILGYGEFYSNFGVLHLFNEGITKMRFEANVASMINEGAGPIISIQSPNSELNVLVRKEIRQNSNGLECIRIVDSPGSVLNLTAVNLIQEDFNWIFSQIGGSNTDTVSHINFDKATSRNRGFLVDSGVAHINGNSIEMVNEEDEPGELRCISSVNTAETYVNVNSMITNSVNNFFIGFIRVSNNSTLHLRSKFCKLDGLANRFIDIFSFENEEMNLFFDIDYVEFGKVGMQSLQQLLAVFFPGAKNVKGRFGKVVYLGTEEFRFIQIGSSVSENHVSSYNVNITVESDMNNGEVTIFPNSNRTKSSFKLNAKNIHELLVNSSPSELSTFDIQCNDILNRLDITSPQQFNGNLKLKCKNISNEFRIDQGSGIVDIEAFDIIGENIFLTNLGNFHLKAKTLRRTGGNLTILNNTSGTVSRLNIDRIDVVTNGLTINSDVNDIENPYRLFLKSKEITVDGPLNLVGNSPNVYDIQCDNLSISEVSTFINFQGSFKFHVNRSANITGVNGIRIAGTSGSIANIDLYMKYCETQRLSIQEQSARCKAEFDEILITGILNIFGCDNNTIDNSEPSVHFKARVLNHMLNQPLQSDLQRFALGTDLTARPRDTAGSLLRDPAVIGSDGGNPNVNTFPLGTHRVGTLIFDVETLRTTQNVQICGSYHNHDLGNLQKASEMIRVEILGKSWNIENGRITTGAYQKAQVVYDVGVINWHQLNNADDESFIYNTNSESHSPVFEILFGKSNSGPSIQGGSVVFKDTTVVSLNGSTSLGDVRESTLSNCMILWMQPAVSVIQRNSAWIIKGANGVTDDGVAGLEHIALPVTNNKAFAVMSITAADGFERTDPGLSNVYWAS